MSCNLCSPPIWSARSFYVLDRKFARFDTHLERFLSGHNKYMTNLGHPYVMKCVAFWVILRTETIVL